MNRLARRSALAAFLWLIVLGGGCESDRAFDWGAPHDYDYADFEHIDDWSALATIDTVETGLYFVYLYGVTCPACVSLKPDILAFAGRNAGDYSVYLVDVYAGVSGSPPFAIGGAVPQLLAVQEGQLADLAVGTVEIRAVMRNVLEKRYLSR